MIWLARVSLPLTVSFVSFGAVAAEKPAYRMELEAAASLEKLSGGRADWRSEAISLRAEGQDKRSYGADLLATERFGQQDTEVTLTTYQPLRKPWGVLLEASASPTHRILPRESLFAQAEYRFEAGWGAMAGYRRSLYDRTNTDLAIGTIDRYFSRFRAAYSIYLGRPDGAGYSPSHRLQWSYFYGDQGFIGLSAAAGRELENVYPTGILSTQVRNLSLTGRHEFSPGWCISYEILTQRQGDLYTRRGARLGIRHIF